MLERFVGANSHWISFLAPDPATRSSTRYETNATLTRLSGS